jgi:uncharacterized protein
MLRILTFIFLTAICLNAYAEPSFDCNKATTAVEKDICTHPETAELDKQLASLFDDLKKHPEGKLSVSVKELIKNQREWLKTRGDNNCLGECLTTEYKQRIKKLSFPGAPQNLDDAKVNALTKYFSDKTCEDVPTQPEDTLMDVAGIDQFACKLYETNPTLASKLFSGCYGGNRDNFTPRCDYTSEENKIDGMKEYTDFLESLYGVDVGECGTLRYSNYKAQSAAVLLAIYDIHESEQTNTEPYTVITYGAQGLWEKSQYKKYLAFRTRAEKGLEKYYIQFKHLTPNVAKNVARYHINNIAITYIFTNDNWNVKNVDDFLKTGALPDNYGVILYYPNYDYKERTKEEAKPDILPVLLKIAIVNDYSKSDIEKIINAGANLNSKMGDDALMNSVQRPDILQLLIEKGARVNSQNAFGKTPLMYAIQFGNLNAVKILVEHHADVNLATFPTLEPSCDQGGIRAGNRTPLMYAAWHSNDAVMKYLIAHGARTDVKDTGIQDEGGNDYQFYLKKNDYLK